jgi:hypothetical protein
MAAAKDDIVTAEAAAFRICVQPAARSEKFDGIETRMSEQTQKTLLWIIELGGYPDFTELYRRLGYRVETVTSGRKAISQLKKLRPDVVVAAFNYLPDFRDRTSWLESVFATLQQLPEARVVVFYDPQEQAQFDKLRQRFTGFAALPYPLDEESVARALGA